MCRGLIIPQPAAHVPLYGVDSPFCSCLPLPAQGCSQKPDLEAETMFRLSIRGQSSFTVFPLYVSEKASGHKFPGNFTVCGRAAFAAFDINLGATTPPPSRDDFLCCWKYKSDFAMRLLPQSPYCSPGPLYPKHIKQPCPILCHYKSPSLSLCRQFLKGPPTT